MIATDALETGPVHDAGTISTFPWQAGGLESMAVATDERVTGSKPPRSGIEVLTAAGALDLDAGTAVGPEAIATIAAEFAGTARAAPHPLDVQRGLHLQRVITDAANQLGG